MLDAATQCHLSNAKALPTCQTFFKNLLHMIEIVDIPSFFAAKF